MSTDIAPQSYDDRVRLARIAAVEGLGWADLVVKYGLPEDVARLLVWSTAARQKAMREEA
jgi:hypothetical protein